MQWPSVVIVTYYQNQPFKLEDIETALPFLILQMVPVILTANQNNSPRLFSESLIQDLRFLNAKSPPRDGGLRLHWYKVRILGLRPPCNIGSFSTSAGVYGALTLCRVLDWILGSTPSHGDVAHRGR